MYGFLCERLGLIQSAKEAFSKAAKYSNKPEALTNLARTLYIFEEYDEAIECYEKVDERNVNSEIGYALTLFKGKSMFKDQKLSPVIFLCIYSAERYEEAYQAYENVLKSEQLESKPIQPDLLVALASMNYMFGGPEPTKDLLFQRYTLNCYGLVWHYLSLFTFLASDWKRGRRGVCTLYCRLVYYTMI